MTFEKMQYKCSSLKGSQKTWYKTLISWHLAMSPTSPSHRLGRCRGKVGKNLREPYNRNLKGNTPSFGGVTRIQLGNLLENFKIDILGAMGSQLDVLQAKKRKEEERAAMSIFYPICRTKHPQQEFPLNNISVCHICTEEHPTDDCPSLPGLH